MELDRTDTITTDFAKLDTKVVEMTRTLGVESLGLLAGSLTRPAGKLTLSMVAGSLPQGVRDCFEQAGGMTPSVSSLQRVLSSIHWAWQGMEDDALEERRSRETRPKEATSFVVSLDGAMVPLRKDEQPLGREELSWYIGVFGKNLWTGTCEK